MDFRKLKLINQTIINLKEIHIQEMLQIFNLNRHAKFQMCTNKIVLQVYFRIHHYNFFIDSKTCKKEDAEHFDAVQSKSIQSQVYSIRKSQLLTYKNRVKKYFSLNNIKFFDGKIPSQVIRLRVYYSTTNYFSGLKISKSSVSLIKRISLRNYRIDNTFSCKSKQLNHVIIISSICTLNYNRL